MRKAILVVGLFRPANNHSKPVTASQQLADLLAKNNIPVIKTSFRQGRVTRMTDTLFTILFQSRSFSLAIVPLFGTKPSFIWQELATRLLRLLGKPYILVVHGGSIPERMKQESGPFIKALQRADKVVCPSGFLQAHLLQYDLESVIIENVLDLSAYRFVQKENIRPRILWMRSFSDIYNPQMAVRVAALLAKKYTGFKMVMAGDDGGLLTVIQAMVKECRLEEQVTFPGFINRQQKQALAQDFDIYICTNRIDNAPVSVIECMSLGLPVVSVNAGGLPYLIRDGVNGFLVAPDDDKAMAEQIERLINNPPLAATMAANALLYSKQYDETPVLQKWKLLFREMNIVVPESIKSTNA